ncbi:peptidoglycan DD-metalloendopeptidase family protein [Streptomyces sp. NPDC060184]|uniref:M23 family metallopeptidase n=1 Tax=Streptomyces sp. NPDC060184 TaxID=3347064 RepID=UPI00364ACF0C
MPITGKHRRKKSGPIARGILAVGAGGAVVALPLLGATGAHAAEQSAPAVAQSAQQSAKTYKVVSGDYLAKIAAQHKIKGGWEKLYQDNREVIGGNPSLILPGMKLTLGAQASGSASTASAPAAKAETKTEAKTATKAAPAAKTESAATTTKAADSDSTGWTTPVANATVTTQYHASGSMWSSGYHTGSDFSAATGTVVRAVGPGTVVSAGYDGAYGNEVIIKHADGMYSQYAHQSQLMVSVGQTVTGGQQIGLSGATGNVTGPHLHFEIRTTPSYGSDVDPIAYLRLHGVSI